MQRENPNKLTDKQRTFCEEYLIDFNATRAAIKASYSEKTARSQGQRLLTNVDIQNYLSELMSARAERCQISQDKVLEELQQIAFDDIKNHLEYRTEKVKVGVDKDGENIYGYRLIVDMKDSNEIDTRSVQEVSLTPQGGFKFKLYGKDAALIQLGKHLGMFKEQVEHSGGIKLNSGGLRETLAELRKKD